MGTVRSNQGIERRCRAVVPDTTSGDLLLATRTCGWDMITDWPRISTLTCKLKTNFDRRQKTEGDETYDTGLDIEDNDKRIQTENDDIVPETRDHDTGLLTKRHDSKELLRRDQDKGLENRDYDERQYIEDKV